MRISIGELADGRAQAPLLGPGGALLDPLLVVDLTAAASPATVERAARRTGGRILLGLGPRHPALSPALDLTVTPAPAGTAPDWVAAADPEAVLARIAATVAACPQASLALAGVLRTTPELAVAAALDVESHAYSTLLGGAEFRAWLRARGERPPPPDVAEPVCARRSGATLHLTLNRPERRNAYGRQLRDALVETLTVAIHDPTVRRVVLDGAGPVFSSGGDLAEFGTTPDPATAHLVRTRGGAALLLHALAARTQVRLHGACVGAGIELPSFAGTVTADPAATFRLPEVSMGLIPGAGGTVGITRRIGRWRTLHMGLTGDPVPADRALAWGLIDRLEPVPG